MAKNNYLDNIISDNRIGDIEELLKSRDVLTKFISPQQNGRTAVETALRHNKFEIVKIIIQEILIFSCMQIYIIG